jgi:exodeoxyribonuclease V alpha subunit
MINTISDIHHQFASFFKDKDLQPWAWYLSKRLAEGHICIAVNDGSINEAGHPFLIQADPTSLSKAIQYVSTDPDRSAPFILHDNKLYLHRYFTYETIIVTELKKRFARSAENQLVYKEELAAHKELIKEMVGALPKKELQPDQRPDWQLLAVINSLRNSFSIITGGPGTGKTTTLAKLLRLIYTLDPNSRVALAAPTGKASMRMADSLKGKAEDYPDQVREAIQKLIPFTLHRLLGSKKNSIYFKHNQQTPLPYDWVIVDEASMIDVPLFAKLLMGCNEHTRLVLLGDKDQLASVEAGTLLCDICEAAGKLNYYTAAEIEWLNSFIPNMERKIPTEFTGHTPSALTHCITELRLSHRFEQDDQIGQLSRAIILGNTNLVRELLNNTDQKQLVHIENNNDRYFTEFVSGYESFLKEKDIFKALQKLNDLRVLVAVREGDNGLYKINKKIERTLQDLYPKLIKPDTGFYNNCPIIVTKNNYELGLFNGDIGIVRPHPTTKRPAVWFEDTAQPGTVRAINPAFLNHCETVFAMTIHKSQGSEFEQVMLVMPDQQDSPLLCRELLYTGVTRAKKKVCICGAIETLEKGMSKQVQRISGLQSRLI